MLHPGTEHSKRIHLAQGLAIVDGRVLLVASRYASHPKPRWNLPGGRQEPGELLQQTVEREIREETTLSATVNELAYVSESYDGDTHVLAVVFHVDVTGELRVAEGEHVAAAAWVAFDAIGSVIEPAVVREPLLAYLSGELPRQYAARADAGISVRWFS